MVKCGKTHKKVTSVILMVGILLSIMSISYIAFGAETETIDDMYGRFNIETVFQPQKLAPNQMLTAKVTATNTNSVYYEGKKDVLVIVALYDKNSSMVNISYISKGVPYQGTEALSAGFKLPANIQGHIVKSFIWDGTDIKTSNMIPLSNEFNLSEDTTPIPTTIATPTVTPTTTPTTTPITTSTPTNTDDKDAWKNNAGTINLGNTITYTGTGISANGSVVNITAGGDHTVTGTLTNGMIYINTTEKVKLRLSGTSITNSTGPAIYVQNADKAFITLVENTTNTLVDGRTYSDATAKGTLFSNDSLEIKGAGTLNITGNYKHGIVSDDDVVIENGNITVKSAVKDGIHANNNVTINGGTISLTATKDGIDCDGDIIINDGTITSSAADDGIHSALDMTINGGTVNITKAYEGIESKAIMTVNNGTINMVSSEDGLCAGKQLVVNGGIINITAGTDAYDSNGTLTMTGGSSVIYGGRSPDGCADCDTSTFAIKGGTLVAMGGSTSGPTASASTQCSAVLVGASANAVVIIKNAAGTEILNFTVKKEGATLLFTSPLLLSNTTYTMYINGTLSKTFTTSTMVTSAGGSIFGQGGPGGRP